ncbi:hypothetical protein TVAG_276630 [Trichomonas vaginalis G3]|uniref:MULE transposase domain-containing protein n=1 Tax=Trichomonas vaginalis (strain ATCC PRA-98 / G3) TaxID=412133 RepID=A2FFD2_TRIV3|nr:MULE transposase domain-containing protein [Trichomonas vaginalis G3]EAX96378.1 hypothetical protein TVAG_276630 [Trichomonas vaginalis G3]KAI5545319.1 MULE transposase domain-containing protein [Trichomonas vaginalis G3]|eukprot:XP_001309308.1 hypothetical protein [Trichomonas vaginalis G3]
MFCADCALNIAVAVECGFPLAHLTWCAVHVLRAISKSEIKSKFVSNENYETFYILMDFLTLRIDTTDEQQMKEESTAAYENLVTLLEQAEPTAFNYFAKQWRPHLVKWMIMHRGSNEATNNVSESHFRQIKYTVFLGKKHIRIDDFVNMIIREVFPSYLLKIRVANSRDPETRFMRVLQKEKGITEEKRFIQREKCKAILMFLFNALENEAIQPEGYISQLSLLAEIAQEEIEKKIEND